MDRRDFIKATSAGLLSASLPSAYAAPQLKPSQFPQSYPMNNDIRGDLVFSREEFQRRYDLIQASMDQQGIDCLVVTGNNGWYQGEAANLRYVMGDAIYLDPAYVVIPHKGEPILLYKSSKLLKMAPKAPIKKAHLPNGPSCPTNLSASCTTRDAPRPST